MWEQLSLAAFMQRYWADNQVSCTVSFDPETEGRQLERALDFFQWSLKGISFLPKHKIAQYSQMPYEAISKDEFDKRSSVLKPIKFDEKEGEREETMVQKDDRCLEVFCDQEHCNLHLDL